MEYATYSEVHRFVESLHGKSNRERLNALLNYRRKFDEQKRILPNALQLLLVQIDALEMLDATGGDRGCEVH